MIDYRVINIGTLSHHPLWEEAGPVRSAHATTTLIRAGDKMIIVDPSMPDQILEAKLGERAGLKSDQITDVFITNFRPAHRRGITLFNKANWWISESERESVGVGLVQQYEQAPDDEVRELLKQEIAILQQFKAAPDQLAKGVDLFPLPGFTPGTCGLLLPLPSATVLIAGDAVPTAEHLSAGRVLENGYDIDQSRTSLAEVIEIADVIIPGHDNVVINPMRRMM